MDNNIIHYDHNSSVEGQKGANADIPLRSKRTLSLYKVYGDSALLVLNRTSLNSVNALLALSQRMIVVVVFISEYW